MNRIELVRRLVAESGTTGLAIGSTLDQKGDALNFVNWIDDAWLEVQGLHNWPSLWEDAPITIAAGASTATGTLSHKRYIHDSARLNGGFLTYQPWDRFRLAYPSLQAGGSIGAWTIRPDRSIAVNGIVEADTVIQIERYRMPGKLTDNDSVPLLFEEHHMMIVWRALMLYGGFDSDGVQYKRGAAEYAELKRLAAGDLPAMEPGDPLL